jgi:hypothetical protein
MQLQHFVNGVGCVTYRLWRCHLHVWQLLCQLLNQQSMRCAGCAIYFYPQGGCLPLLAWLCYSLLGIRAAIYFGLVPTHNAAAH